MLSKFLFALISIALVFSSCRNKHKIGYINTQVVFNDFSYKQELERELTSIKNRRKFIIDSLETNLKILARQINVDQKNKELFNSFEEQKEIFLTRKQKFLEDEELLVKQYDEKIIKQLNSYTREYGKENNYDVIYGANSTGNIMYADSTLDLTKEVITYMNQKFAGKK